MRTPPTSSCSCSGRAAVRPHARSAFTAAALQGRQRQQKGHCSAAEVTSRKRQGWRAGAEGSSGADEGPASTARLGQQQQQQQQQERPIPWNISFDIRERETIWTDQNKARLVQLFAARELGIDMDTASWRLRQLTLLLPDMGAQVASMRPALLADILRDPRAVAARCVGLHDALPHANVSQLVANQPAVLLQEVAEVVASVDALADTLRVGQRQAQELVTREPRFLDVEGVREVLQEMRRLMPQADAGAALLRDPSWLMRVERGVKRLGPHPDDI